MKLKGCIFLITANAFWGLAFPMVKMVSSEAPPWTFLLIRYLLAAPVFLGYLWQTRAFGKIKGRDWPALALLSLVGIVLHSGLQYLGTRYTTASHAALLIATSPLFVLLLEWVLKGRAPGWQRLVGLIMGLGGMAVILGLSQFTPQAAGGLKGDLIMLASAASWGYATFASKNLNDRYPPFAMTSLMGLGGAIFVFPVVALTGGLGTLAGLPLSIWGAALYLAICSSVLGLWLWYMGLKEINAPVAAMFSFLEPVFGIGASVVFLGEALTWTVLAGSLLIMGGLVVFNLGEAQNGGQQMVVPLVGPFRSI